MSLFNIKKDCTHYQNKSLIYADCCNKYYGCKLCHNEKNNHQIGSEDITKIKCMNCRRDTPKCNFCITCKKNISSYYCYICNIWNDNSKIGHHCHKCNKCINRKPENNFHCDKCNNCFNIKFIDSHNCSNLYLEDKDCSICLENLFRKNIKYLKILNCGHVLHKKCYSEMIKSNHVNNTLCPQCRREI
jgi:RING finger/CHY zinc finger protein 1